MRTMFKFFLNWNRSTSHFVNNRRSTWELGIMSMVMAGIRAKSGIKVWNLVLSSTAQARQQLDYR